MYLRCLFTLAIWSLSLSGLFAQESPTRVSDFNSGRDGKSVIQSVGVADDKLYGMFYQFFGEDNTGLISTLNPITGAATPVLDPDRTEWFGAELVNDRPLIFSENDLTFATQLDRATGNNLYSIKDGEATLLHSAPDMLYSNFVTLNDTVYFMTANVSLAQSALGREELIAEIWRTDGTTEGTSLETTLLSFFNIALTHLVAGEDKLFAAILNDSDQVFYTYTPSDDQLSLVSQDFNQFILQNGPFNKHVSPAVYHDGGFFVAGGTDLGFFAFRIDEEDGFIQAISLPRINEPGTFPGEYDNIDIVTFGDSLYFLAKGRVFGPDLFQFTGDLTFPVRPLLSSERPANGFNPLDFKPTVFGDTLYFLSAHDELEITGLYGYAEGMTTPRLYTTFPLLLNEAIVDADERYLYVTSLRYSQLTRVDRLSGTVESIPFYVGVNGPRTVISPLALLDGDVYFINSPLRLPESNRGLFRWQAGVATPEKLGSYQTEKDIFTNVIQGVSSAENRVVVYSDSLLVYDIVNDAFAAPQYASEQLPNSSLSIVGTVNNDLFIASFNSDFKMRLWRLVGNQMSAMEVVGRGIEVNADNYRVRHVAVIDRDKMRLAIVADSDISNEESLVLAEFDGNTMTISPLPPFVDSTNLIFKEIDDTHFVAYRTLPDAPETEEYYLYTYEGTELAQFQAPAGSAIRGVTTEGFFLETVETSDFSFTPLFYYYNFETLSTPEVLNPTEGAPAYSNSNYYTLNGNLVFMGDSPISGREWLVAKPGSGTYDILKDINPGPFGSTVSTFGLSTGDRLYFSATSPETGRELWTTNGTTEGTTLVTDINEGPGYSNPSNFTLVDSTLFFSANGPSGYELYRLRLGETTSELVADVYQGIGNSHPYNITVVGSKLCFMARDGADATNELFIMDLNIATPTADLTITPARIYPNPVIDRPLTVEASENESITRIEVFGTSGKLLREFQARGTHVDINLSPLPAGTYWLRTWYASGRFSINAVQRVK